METFENEMSPLCIARLTEEKIIIVLQFRHFLPYRIFNLFQFRVEFVSTSLQVFVWKKILSWLRGIQVDTLVERFKCRLQEGKMFLISSYAV